MIQYESQLRVLGAEMAMIAARHELSISIAMYREDRATVRLQRGGYLVSVEFDLTSIDIELDGYFREYLARAVAALVEDKQGIVK